ncbi:Na/Pi cotransporter family protein [Telmatospirillum sp. J64-1]|uniref:Na/Pi cotransporter family protein n=1 Tax=Telmatospirillum sp. J64-1 TaxID=2502183 RepID=UPI00115F6F0B|nr:Na/Pi symporter [Telmatospirillum sp. J64-1]
MSMAAMATAILGGVGLFLLGMWLMTEGLKLAAGDKLRDVLASWTRSPARGLVAGAVLTAAVQSSSAVTVAAIGFVNAGLLSLSQSIWVVFGSNVGTTFTGWLVALIGFKIKIDAFALPAIGIGMILRLTGAGTRRGALGQAVAGFGILFLGIDVLGSGFQSLGTDLDLGAFAGHGWLSDVLFVVIGFTLTLLMQASAAAIAITLTATAGGLIPLEQAAAVVIGANLGTTSTAVLSVIGATPNAKRVAASHVVFNLLTGSVALLILPWVLGAVEWVRDVMELEQNPATTLALFHTLFNCLGVLLIWPLAGRMVAFLSTCFVSSEENEVKPRHLDKTLLPVPVLALNGLLLELRRVADMAASSVRDALERRAPPARIRARRMAVDILTDNIGEFTNALSRTALPAPVAGALEHVLRATQHVEEIADIATEIVAEDEDFLGEKDFPPLAPALRDYRARILACLDGALGKGTEPSVLDPDASRRQEQEIEDAYQSLKALLLHRGAVGEISVTRMDRLLHRIDRLRRCSIRAVKAARRMEAVRQAAEPAAPKEPVPA